jgi:glucose/arabinose dehydrogenase
MTHPAHRIVLAFFAVGLFATQSPGQAVTSGAPGGGGTAITSPPAQPANTAHPGGKLSGNVAIQLVEVAGNFVDPINVSSPHDGTGRLFVCERPGVIRIIGRDGKVIPHPFYDNRSNTNFQFLEQGLYCITFHPKFKENGRFFVSYADMWFNGSTFIVEYKVDAHDPNVADMASAKPIMRIDFPYCNHHGGKVEFGPDGCLYVGVGDGGWEGDVLSTGQDLSTWMGKMLRIDVDHQKPHEAYSVPDGNPFVGAADPQLMVLFGKSETEFSRIKQKAKPEIWAYGLRNPWTFSFDRKTGDLYMADVGQNTWEEVDFQPASSKGGENYGWSFMNGTHPFPIEKEQSGEKTPVVGTLPVAEYSHATDGICIIGFGVYRGTAVPGLDGAYLCGDWGSGRIWGIRRDDDGKWQMQQLVHTGMNLSSGGEDEAGDLYVTNMGSQYGTWNPFDSARGSVWKVVSADRVPNGAKTAPLATK